MLNRDFYKFDQFTAKTDKNEKTKQNTKTKTTSTDFPFRGFSKKKKAFTRSENRLPQLTKATFVNRADQSHMVSLSW